MRVLGRGQAEGQLAHLKRSTRPRAAGERPHPTSLPSSRLLPTPGALSVHLANCA